MATAYLTPGVYVEEVPGGPKPIEGVGTAVAAFLGIAEKGPVGKAIMVTNLKVDPGSMEPPTA